MNHMVSLTRRALAAVLSAGMVVSGIPGSLSKAAEAPSKVYAAAYQGAAGTEQTTLPDTIEVDGVPAGVTWNLKNGTFSVPYETVNVTGKTQKGTSVEAQVEVIPAADNPLVYFVDASRDSGKESKAYESVKALADTSLKNQSADGTYSDSVKWGRSGNNFKEKSTSNVDITKKIQTGWYSGSKTSPLTYKYYLEAGDYTLTAGFYEWWATSARSTKLVLHGEGMTQAVSDTAAMSSKDQAETLSLNFTVDTACTVTMEVQNPTGGEAPVISWFAVAQGEVYFPGVPDQEVEIVVDGDNVDAAAKNVNGLTYKGYGVLSGNSTSNLLMDYKTEAPDVYQQLLEVLFGGEYPLMTHIKMEMGNDGNNSTGADSCTMRFEEEEADVSRSPGFQLAADAKKINPDVKVSFLYWERPAWVQQAWTSDRKGAGYDALYKWYRETVFDAYEKYGYVVDYINPDKNETSDPDEDLIKWFKNKLVTEQDFPEYMDEAAQEAYHNIKIIASDENTSLNIVPSMRNDKDFYDVVDAIGFHYRAGDASSTADYRTMADVDDKEIWYSEGCASFSYTEYQENKNVEYGGGTIGGYQSPLALVDNFIKSFVYSRKTHYIFQPALGSFYEGAQYDHKEILSAREPWAGYIHYDPSIYMLEHFSKFAVSGWENDDNTAGIWRVIPGASANDSTGSDHLKNESGKPSYMTLAAPDKSDYSVVIVNNSSKTLEYVIRPENMGDAQDKPMEIWETRTDSYLQYQGEAIQEEGEYHVTVTPFSMVTVTTLDCDKNPEYTGRLPEEGEKTVLDTDSTGKNLDTTDNILYADDYEYADYPADYLSARGNEPRYTVDFSGAFAVEDGQLKQLLSTHVNEWNSNNPSCVVGDFRWANYKAIVDVAVSESGFAGINIRQQTGMNFEGSGYNLQIKKDGTWTLKKRGTVLDSGRVASNPEGKYHLALEGKGAFITAWVDDVEVSSYADANPEYYGRVRLGCDWSLTSFDNLKVEKAAGYYPYASEMIDNASDEVSYMGTWSIIAGAGGSNNDWYRSTSTSSTAGSSFSFAMKGDGFALIGQNNGSAVIDVAVDGKSVTQDDSTSSSGQHGAAYILTGLGDSAHEVTVTLKSGTFVLDAVYFLPYSDVDPTALAALLAEAGKIEHREDVIEDTWNALQEAILKAEKVMAGAEAGEAAQQEIDSAYILLKTALDGLLYNGTVVDAENIFTAAYAGADLKLPENVSCTTADGTKAVREVIWDTENVKLEAYQTVTLTGTVKEDGYEVTAAVEVVPENLVYFIDSGIDVSKETATPVFDAVKALVTDLKNDKADQAYEEGKTVWGHDTSKVSVKTGENMYDKYASGIWATGSGSGSNPIVYTLPMEAGVYRITAGFHEWWSVTRGMDVTASWKDAEGNPMSAVLADNLVISGSKVNDVADGEIILGTDTVVTISVTLGSGSSAPVMSWLAAAKTQDAEGAKIVTVTDPDRIAAVAGSVPSLPETVEATTAAGQKKNVAVEWDLENADFTEPYETVTVTGKIADAEEIQTQIKVEVIPENLQYFISAGTGTGYSDNKTKAAVSQPYNAVAGLVKDLGNKTSDAAYTQESGWGYVIDGTYKANSTVNNGDRPEDYISTDKYQVGLRDKTNGARPMTYRFTLQAGEYELTTGYHEFYGANRSRDMQPSVSWTDFAGMRQKAEGALIQLRSADQKGTISFTLDHECVVEFQLVKTGGEAPMYSWLGISKTGDVVEAGYNVEYLKSVMDRQQKEMDETTAEGYIYVESTKTAYDNKKADAQKLVQDESRDENVVKLALEALNQAFAGLKVTKIYDSFTGAKGTGTQEWLDTEGDHIQAHGGQVQWLDSLDLDGDGVSEGGWIWYGEDKTRNGKPIDGVRCYTSADLYNWTDQGTALRTHDMIPAKLADGSESEVVDDLEALKELKSWAEMSAPTAEVSQEDMDMAKAFTEAYRNADGTYDEEELLLAFRYLYTGYCITERPKMLYNESTEQYVLIWHADGPSDENIAKWLKDPSQSPSRYTRASMGFAVSDTPYGPFEVVNVQRMNYVEGYYDKSQGMARDMNVFIDDTDIDKNGVKDAYAIYSSEENAKMYISLLNGDYTGPATQGTQDSMALGDGTVVKTFAARVLPDNNREAPALFKYDGYYYMITSGTSGWNPNKATYYRSTSIYGPYEAMGDPCAGTDSALTFRSQSTCVFPVDAEKGKFMYMGDRWLVGDTGSAAWWSSYVWLPVQINEDHTITLNRYEDWDMEGLVTIEPISAAALEGQVPALPETIKVDYFSGASEERSVNWNLDSVSFTGGLFRDVTVSGAVEGTDVSASAQVKVLPAAAEYVIDCNNPASPVFETVKQLAGGDLLQTAADQAKTADNTWGYTGVTGTDIKGKDGVGTDIYPTGWYALAGKDISYQVTLPAGTHKISLGFQDWWGQYDSRPMAVYTTSGGTESKLCDVPAPRQNLVEAAGAITLTEEALVTVTVKKAGEKDPILNWIVIEKDPSQAVVDKTALKNRIADAQALDPDKYTEESYGNVTAMKAEAEKVYQDPLADQAAVDKAYTDLDNAIKALADRLPELEREELLAVIAAAGALHREDYTAESYAAMEEVLQIALGYAGADVSGGNAVTQQDINDAAAALRQAVKALVPVGSALNKAELLIVIAEAEALEENKYTAESYAAVTEALREARKLAEADVSGGDVSPGDSVTQDQINTAAQALRSAIDSLVEKTQTDKAALKELVEAADAVDRSKYTSESYAAFTAVLNAADAVLLDPGASQESIDAAVLQLKNAFEALVPVQPGGNESPDDGQDPDDGQGTGSDDSGQDAGSGNTSEEAAGSGSDNRKSPATYDNSMDISFWIYAGLTAAALISAAGLAAVYFRKRQDR